MRIKISFVSSNNEFKNYLVNLPNNLKYIYDLKEYLYEKFDFEKLFPNISTNKQSFSLFIDGYQLSSNEKIEDLIQKENEIIKYKETPPQSHKILFLG